MSSIMSNLSSVEISTLLFRGFSFLLYGRNCILLMPSRLLKCGPLQRGLTEGNLKCGIVSSSHIPWSPNQYWKEKLFPKSVWFWWWDCQPYTIGTILTVFPTVLKLNTCFKLQVKTKNANESLNNFWCVLPEAVLRKI